MLAEARGIQSSWIWGSSELPGMGVHTGDRNELGSSTGVAQFHEKHILDSPAKLTCQSSNPDSVLLQPNGTRTGRVLQKQKHNFISAVCEPYEDKIPKGHVP